MTVALQYRGRFAPSPTGPLHLGSMFAALGSFLQAKSQSGKWLVRIDDLDPPREMKGATKSILHTLESYGLCWDEEVIYQSHQHALYEQALNQLSRQDLLFNCLCSRKQIKEIAASGPLGFIYPGTCREKKISDQNSTIRLKTKNEIISFNDSLQGKISQNVATQTGDVALKRADGLYAYHLANVIDDYEHQITEIVRGIDLLDCTPIQIYLQKSLNFPTPNYLHLPIIVNQNNEKLSKQTKAQAIDLTNIETTLLFLLEKLNQQPPAFLKTENKTVILNWAIKHWDLKKIHDKKSIKTF